MSEIDLTLALQLQAQFEEELRVSLLKQQQQQQENKGKNDTSGRKKMRNSFEEPQQEKLSVSLTDPTWELVDPNPDIHTLFLTFNDQFFWGRLAGVEVRWSPRMTLCAGVCCYEGRGGLCSVRLSLPLLKLRPRKDLVETLLHEMIHAYLFVTANNRDRDGHGPEFHKHMYRINGVAGTNITVFHSFHDEVDVYRQHIWQCNGPCRTRRPYFGLLKRSMNRAPGPKDHWWGRHQQTCGGTYVKIQEPDRPGAAKKESRTANGNTSDSGSDIRKYFGSAGKGSSLGGSTSKAVHSGKLHPVHMNKNDDSSKENTPVGNEGKRTGSGSKHFPTKSNEKQNNVKGFASTSSGEVNQIKVTGASRSNVHGFGGRSPARKKLRGDNGAAAGKNSGSTNQASKEPRGSGGTGLATRGRGSRTVTLKGKPGTQTETRVKESNNEGHVAFQGQGYTLGGTTGKASKLLSLSASSQTRSFSEQPSTSSQIQTGTKLAARSSTETDRGESTSGSPQSSPTGNAAKKLQRSLDCYVVTPSSQPGGRMVQCPVCDVSVPEREVNRHLDECVGNLSDEDGMKDENKPAPRDGAAASAGGEVVCLGNVSECGSGDEEEHSQASPQKCLEDKEVKQHLQYPCPVCGEHYPPATINQHVDSHF